MRLRTCLALELIVGVVLVAVLGLSAAWGVELVRPAASLQVATARITAATTAARRDEAPPAATEPAPAADAAAPEVVAAPSADAGADTSDTGPGDAGPGDAGPGDAGPDDAGPGDVDTHDAGPGEPSTAFALDGDDVRLAPLRAGRLVAAKINRGGSTVSLRLEFEGGARAAFKPEQTSWQSMPRKEIAAYRIDRLLGFGAVAPSIGRQLPADELYARLVADSRWALPRMRKEIITRDDPAEPGRPLVAGSLSWWIPVIQNARIGEVGVDALEGIVTWRRQLRAGARVAPEHRDLIRQISNLLLFDYLIDNVDRWSGSNVKADATGRTLFFMDNTMSFTRDRAGHRKGQDYLERTQTFSRRLVGRLRALTEDELRAALATDADSGPFTYLLSGAEIQAVLGRREAALAYIDGLIARFGEAKVLAFP